MRKALFLVVALIVHVYMFGQGEIWSTKSFNVIRDGRQAEEVRTYTTKFDSIVSIEDDKISYMIDGKNPYIDLDYHTIVSITINDDEWNRDSRKKIEELHQQHLRGRELGKSVGWFATGTLFIFLAQPISDGVTKKMDIKKDEDADDFAKRVRRTYNGIYWSFTGVGAICELVGFCKVVNVASGAKLKYGVTSRGATITYQFAK